MAPCPLNLKECKISFSQVKMVSKVEFNFGWHTWKLHYQNCSTLGRATERPCASVRFKQCHNMDSKMREFKSLFDRQI